VPVETADLAAFTPGRINGLRLRNRIIKTATYEGMSPGGAPNAALVEHHVALARGGVGMSTLAYCAVDASGRTFADQLVVNEAAVEPLRQLTSRVHEAGAAMSIQLTHCGGFSKDLAQGRATRPGPRGPSRALNLYGMLRGLVWIKAMDDSDIAAVIQQFARAAGLAKQAGFDAVELHLGHGYLLSQFLSPALNRRRDRWGGSLENRSRLPLAVVAAVREAVGPTFPILAKTNLRDAIRGGLELDEAVAIARSLEDQPGGVDALVLSGGVVSRSAFYLMRGARPLKEMIAVEDSAAQRWALRLLGRAVIRALPFEELYFLPLAREVRDAVRMPLVLLGGAVSRQNLVQAMDEGFEFVAIGRALLHNPNFVDDLRHGRVERSPCNHCNVCVAEMDRNGVRCVLPDASG
jgi:2,4-dienoyl-CoA reductase-like NADH-dependent reductase (Old Yellow Enzyme family)